MAFSNVEPWGSDVHYLGHAIVASTIANVNRAKGQKEYKPIDFMPMIDTEPQSTEQMLQFAQMMTHAMGGEDHSGG